MTNLKFFSTFLTESAFPKLRCFPTLKQNTQVFFLFILLSNSLLSKFRYVMWFWRKAKSCFFSLGDVTYNSQQTRKLRISIIGQFSIIILIMNDTVHWSMLVFAFKSKLSDFIFRTLTIINSNIVLIKLGIITSQSVT